MKRTVRTRGGRHAAAALGKPHKPTGRVAVPVEPDAETRRLRRLNSLVRWVADSRPAATENPTPDGGRIRLRTDITESKQAEQTLRHSRATLQSMIDAADEMIAMVNGDGVIVAINRSGAAGFGRRPRDLVGRSLVDLFDPEPAARVRDVIQGALTSRDRMQVEFSWRDQCFHLAAHPVTNAGGAPAAVCIVSRDITARVRAEQEAREHRHQLMRYMRIAAMGETTAALAHELNQPIAAIVNYCNGSLRRLASGRWNVDVLTEAVNETRAEARRARDIIRNVSRFVREAPRERVVTDIGTLVGSIDTLIGRDLRRHGIELAMDLATPSGPLRVNVVEIEQTFLNLLRNAMESVAGSPEPTRRIEVRARAEGDELHVSVRDGGTGFSPEAAARAFDPFFTTKAEGMGMGLAICRTIVEQHGGRIWAEPGGSAVHFTLPISEAHDAAA